MTTASCKPIPLPLSTCWLARAALATPCRAALRCACRSSASSSSGGSSGGVSSGAAAGIGIGCAVGGALIAAAITYYLMKKKTVYLPHLDESEQRIAV